MLGSDQGAAISVNGGHTWSSWYNQPTAQFYHVITDNRFPYWVYGSQQDSGTAAVVSRGDYGQISFRDWHPIGGGESGYVAPDPLHPDIVYGGSSGGIVMRWNQVTGQSQNVSPSSGADKYRFTWTFPIVFSPQDPRTLYVGAQYVLATHDGGQSWQTLSPDLTQYQASEAAPGGLVAENYKNGENRGVVYTIAPSPAKAGLIWAGTDDGLVWITQDGGQHWSNVTPSGLPAWSKISLIDASRLDPATAYAAVDRHRLDDFKPCIYRTHDFGRTWQAVVADQVANRGLRQVQLQRLPMTAVVEGDEDALFRAGIKQCAAGRLARKRCASWRRALSRRRRCRARHGEPFGSQSQRDGDRLLGRQLAMQIADGANGAGAAATVRPTAKPQRDAMRSASRRAARRLPNSTVVPGAFRAPPPLKRRLLSGDAHRGEVAVDALEAGAQGARAVG